MAIAVDWDVEHHTKHDQGLLCLPMKLTITDTASGTFAFKLSSLPHKTISLSMRSLVSLKQDLGEVIVG